MLLDKVGFNTRRASGTFYLPLVALLGLMLIDGAKWYAILTQETCHRSLAAIILVMIPRVLRLYKHPAQRTPTRTPRALSVVLVKPFSNVLHGTTSKLAEHGILRCPVRPSSQSNKASLSICFENSNYVLVVVLQCIISCGLAIAVFD